jgi:F0F1-type ATP synthase assembly protein I
MWMGTACAVSVIGGGAIGYGLDDWWHTSPIFTFVGLAFGILCAVLSSIVQIRKFS